MGRTGGERERESKGGEEKGMNELKRNETRADRAKQDCSGRFWWNDSLVWQAGRGKKNETVMILA